MDQDGSTAAPDLGNIYMQCKNARETSSTMSYTKFDTGHSFSTGTAKAARIGNLNMVGDTEVEKTFHGARICKGNKTVNECVSMSFDPRNYVCIGCKIHHKIGEKGPLVICFADQNMVPFITDGEGNCMAIVRLENASLADLIDISFEILEKLAPPPGSVILYGSVSPYTGLALVSTQKNGWTVSQGWGQSGVISMCVRCRPLSGKIARGA
jgi:hypothetical protein